MDPCTGFGELRNLRTERRPKVAIRRSTYRVTGSARMRQDAPFKNLMS